MSQLPEKEKLSAKELLVPKEEWEEQELLFN